MEDYKKKYENALNAAHKFKNDCPSLWDTKSNPFKGVFEELEESEDERIQKDLINYFGEHKPLEHKEKDVVAWLEKQGEQKTVSKTEPIVEGLTTEFQKQVSHLIASAMDKEHEYTKGYVEWVAQSLLGYAKNERTSIDEIKPKFKVGDWVVSPNGVHWHIDSINNNRYEVSSTNGACADWPLDTDLYHLWTIQDAKDGDVLCYRNDVFLVKHYVLFNKVVSHCTYGERFIPHNIYSFTRADFSKIYPATKEQRDLLFSKMKDAGYEWDAEKKELKKIEQCENYHCCGEVDNEALQKTLQIWFDKGKCSGRDEVIFHPEKFGLQKQVGQKPAWSEEDEKIIKGIIDDIQGRLEDYPIEQLAEIYFKEISWLKSLKNRVQLQPKQEWSEEEKARIDKIIDVLDWAEEKGRISYSDWEDYVCYVKSLKPQNT